jgi:hypothetical protein
MSVPIKQALAMLEWCYNGCCPICKGRKPSKTAELRIEYATSYSHVGHHSACWLAEIIYNETVQFKEKDTMLVSSQALDLVLECFAKLGMTQSGLEARDFAVWLSQQEVANICELGTGAGGMFMLMDRCCAPGLRISMDMPWDQRDPKMPSLQQEKLQQAVPDTVEIFGEIHNPEKQIELSNILTARKEESRSLDLLFIDADHSYSGCKKHVEMYASFVKAGGFIGFHDLSNGWPCGDYVKSELFPKYKHWIFEEAANLFGIGVIQLP